MRLPEAYYWIWCDNLGAYKHIRKRNTLHHILCRQVIPITWESCESQVFFPLDVVCERCLCLYLLETW
jgi:hypothetical protein